MSEQPNADVARGPQVVIGPDGKPSAVLVDLPTWRRLLATIEDQEDADIFRKHAQALAEWADGRAPKSWMTLEEFDAALDAAEAGHELPA